jgi:hypothetical protein
MIPKAFSSLMITHSHDFRHADVIEALSVSLCTDTTNSSTLNECAQVHLISP